jgi:uncharacterized protein
MIANRVIADFHVHVFSPEVVENGQQFCGDRNYSALFKNDASRKIDAEVLLKEMNVSGVDYAVALGFAWEGYDNCERHNDYMAAACAGSNGRILPFGSVPAEDSADVHKSIENIKNRGLYGIGEIAFYADGFTAKKEGHLGDILLSARTHGLPVCLHVNEPVGHIYNGKYDMKMGRLYRLLQEHRDVTVILSHWGGGMVWYELMPEVQEALENVYYDTAASPFLYKDSVYAVASKILNPVKILFGSDYPLIPFRRYVEAIDSADLTEEVKRGILGENTLRLLGLQHI